MIWTQVPRASGVADRVAGLDFAGAAERRAGPGIGSADGIAVARGAMEGRVVAVGGDFFGEDVTESVPEANRRGRWRAA